MNSPGLQIDGIEVHRGSRTILRDVTISAPFGEITALVGANGSGKSTTVLAIAGILGPTKGKITLGGTQLASTPHEVRRAGLSVVLEGHHVLGRLSVLDNLRAAASMLKKNDVDPAISRSLELFPELKPCLTIDAGFLSGGQKQMLAIAQALIPSPRIMVIDELSLGLAPIIVTRLFEKLVEIAASGVGVLLIEQFAHLALSVSNGAYVMDRGRVAHAGPARELKERPDILHGTYLGAGSGDHAPMVADGMVMN